MKQQNSFLTGVNKKAPMSFGVCAFLFFTVFFFTPSDVLLSNANEFHFSYGQVWWVLLAGCGCLTAVCGTVLTLLPLKASVVANLVLFAGGLCCYVQSLFLNGQMGGLTGERIVYSNTLIFTNLAIWVALFALLFVVYGLCRKYRKKKYVRKGLVAASLCLVLLQVCSLGYELVVGRQEPQADHTVFLGNDGQLQLSTGKNTVIFLVDTCDDEYFESALNNYPDMTEGFDGFVYYPDCVSTHSRTYPSLPYLLSGQKCYFDRPFNEFCAYAQEQSTYLKDIHDTGCNTGIYTETAYVGSAAYDAVDNLCTGAVSEQRMILPRFVKVAMKMGVLRNAPYLIKNRFLYGTNQVNDAFHRADLCIQQDDARFYAALLETPLTATKAYDTAFRLYHLWGAHPGTEYNENFEPVKSGDPVVATRASMRLIRTYIDQMKQLGVYRDATIILTADHGSSNGSSAERPLEIDRAPRCLMFVKQAGVGNNTVETDDDTPYTVSDAPVCHEDLFATVMASVGGDTAKYGQTLFEHTQGEIRTRYYYNSALYDDIDGEVALREYAVTGDSRDFANWSLTGNNWDIEYSERAVSKHRLSEVYPA